MMFKSKNLIILFTTLFLILLGIQGYFMYKTYQVKEREIYRDMNNRLSSYTDDLEDKKGLKKASDDDLQNIFAQYNDKKITQKAFLNLFDQNRKTNQKSFSDYVDNLFKKEDYKVAVRIQYLSIVSLPTKIQLLESPITIFETRNQLVKPGITNTGRWETTSKSTNDINGKLERNNSFLIKSRTDFEILNIKSLVFKELTFLFLSCIAILFSVLMLYIFTVKNLIRQQKQVEVLHTVVDNISHEFKTPIATLKIASKTLKKEFNPETLHLVDRQINRLESLMFQLHKDESGEKLTKTQPQDWDFFIKDLSFAHPDILFDLKNSVDQEILFDKNLMETVIKNLCENSVKYGASEVKIEINIPKNSLEIKVTDNGNGIEKKELKNIFEKFYRIQSNNIHNSKGLGLGLYFVKRIIDGYNGKIDVSSLINEGTTFKITLPYEN